MADDPNKRGPQDRKRVGKQTHEQAYQKRKSAKRKTPHHPVKAPQKVNRTVALLVAV